MMAVAALAESVAAPRRPADDGDVASDAPDAPRAHLLHAHWHDQPRPSPADAVVSFAHRPLPTWTFRTEFGVVERTVALRRAAPGTEPALLVRWRNLDDRAVRLSVRPLLGFCDADHLPPSTTASMRR